MSRVKLFLTPQFRKEQDLRLLDLEFIEKVPTPEEADFIIVPQFVRRMDAKTRQYLGGVRALCQKHGKPGVIVKGGDLSYRFSIPDFIVFSFSLYRSRNTGEVAVPAPIEDLSLVPFAPRTKGEKPVISFCGYAGFDSLGSRVKYLIKNAVLSFAPTYRRGIYWRKRAMALLTRDARLVTRFIIRNTFAGKSGRFVSPEERQEFIESITRADFVLCPKGDGNYSARFYETLALGRIPILIDTDMVLPLEKVIDYDQFIVRVPSSDLTSIGDYVVKWYGALSPEEWIERQNLARETFEKYLRYDRFFSFVLPRLVENGAETLN